jgi:assimilatory nitrate reductase catalytic subunit
MHWTDQLASGARIDALIAPDVDPVSGQPELKHTPVRIAPFAASWYGFAISSERPSLHAIDYWALARAKTGWRMEIAGLSSPGDWNDLARVVMAKPEANDALEISPTTTALRTTPLRGIRQQPARRGAFVAPSPVTAARSYSRISSAKRSTTSAPGTGSWPAARRTTDATRDPSSASAWRSAVTILSMRSLQEAA